MKRLDSLQRSMQAWVQRFYHRIMNEELPLLLYAGPYVLEEYFARANLVYKPIRMRARCFCHECKAGFARSRECPECKHRRCKQCILYPLRRASRGSKAADDLFSHGQSSQETSL